MNQWDSPRLDLGFCESFGGLTRELYDLGFEHRALACMLVAVGGMHWRCGDILFAYMSLTVGGTY